MLKRIVVSVVAIGAPCPDCNYDGGPRRISTFSLRPSPGCRSGPAQLPDRPDLDGAAGGGGAAGGPGDRLVEIRHVDQVVAAELLLGIGVGAVEHVGPAVADPDVCGGLVRLVAGAAH